MKNCLALIDYKQIMNTESLWLMVMIIPYPPFNKNTHLAEQAPPPLLTLGHRLNVAIHHATQSKMLPDSECPLSLLCCSVKI